MSVLYFQNPINEYTTLGYGVTVVGVVMYSKVGIGCAWGGRRHPIHRAVISVSSQLNSPPSHAHPRPILLQAKKAQKKALLSEQVASGVSRVELSKSDPERVSLIADASG